MNVDRIKGRLQRLYIAVQKDDLTRERFSEYEASIAQYTSALIAAIGVKEADIFIKDIKAISKSKLEG